MLWLKSLCLAAVFSLSFSFGCGGITKNADLKSTPNNQTNSQTNKTNEQANLQTPPPQENPAKAPKDDFEGTAGIIRKEYRIKETAILKDVRVARHENYDRIAFEFQTAEMPSYKIEYIDKPVRQCGSGNTVPLAGDGWLEISLTPAQAHDDKGRPTVKNREQKFDFPILKEAKITCDFEAEVVFVLGVASPNKYRVIELKNPVRLAIDIKH
jgi:hypothetical protein